MSQMDSSIKKMLEGLDEMTSNLEDIVSNSYSQMTPEQAILFAKELQKQKVDAKMSEAAVQINELKKTFKI